MSIQQSTSGEGVGVVAPWDDAAIFQLEDQITELCANMHAAMYRLLVLIEQFDRIDGWAGPGVASCAHWLSWRCGIALGAAREKVRVARALPSLPLLSEAFARGELSYSKMRALTRVATPANEKTLLAIAQAGTASHVEKTVRMFRRVDRSERQENKPHANRALSYYWDEDGSLVIRGRLPAEQGALLVKALEAAREALREEAYQRVSAETSDPGAAQPNGAGECEVAHKGVFAEISDAADSAESPGCECKPAHQDVSAETHDEDANELPEIVAEHERADALARVAEAALSQGPASLSGGERTQVMLHVDLATLRDQDEGLYGAVEDGPSVPVATARRMSCDASLVRILESGPGEPLDIGRRSRTVPPAMRRALGLRDGGCRFPGCTRTRYVDAHHIEHWADGGATKLDNLVLMCRRHHRLLHEGGCTLVRDGGSLVFRGPGGRVIEPVPPLRPANGNGADHIARENEKLGLDIGPERCVPSWRGERPDYDWMVTLLQQYDEHTEADATHVP